MLNALFMPEFYYFCVLCVNFVLPIVALVLAIICMGLKTHSAEFFKNVRFDFRKKLVTIGNWLFIYLCNTLINLYVALTESPLCFYIDNRYNPMEPMPFYQYAFFLIWIAVFIYLFSDAITTYQIHKIPMHVITIVFGTVVTGLDLYQMFSPNRLPDEYAFAQYAMLIGYTACGLWTIFGKQPRAVSPQQE